MVQQFTAGSLGRPNLSRSPFKLKNAALCLAMACSMPAFAEHVQTPGVDVVEHHLEPLPASHDNALPPVDLMRARTNASDTAGMLDGQPGVSLYRAGGLSSLPAIHGLADDRIRVKIDGMDLISGCANHMNPPLSYIDPTGVSSVRIFAGLTPVSAGGDSIAGSVLVASAPPQFANPGEGLLFHGQAGTFYRSNNHARGVDLSATAAGEKLSVSYSGSYVKANNYEAADSFKPAGIAADSDIAGGDRGFLDGDEVGSSHFKSQNHALDFALRHDNHLLGLKLGYQDIPYQGFPNQRMDMTGNESRQFNLSYAGQYGWGNLEARVYHERTDHTMNFGDDKLFMYASMMLPVAGMPMQTEGRNSGLSVKADIVLSQRDLLRVGSEIQRYRLDDWWDPVANAAPMMGPETFRNIHDGQRDRYALFGEWEARWTPQWTSQLGVRHESVKMDAGRVQGYSVTDMMMPMMAYGDPNDPNSIPGAFNAADRSRTDRNVDFTALLRFTPDATRTFEGGYSRKTRSPNLYERYTWSYNNSMVMNMNNWFGDGNGYVGNLALDAEVAHTISVSAGWHDAAQQDWAVRITPYFTYVDDYIDAVDCAELGKCPMMARMDGFNNLTLDNQSARIYGLDLSGNLTLVPSGAWGSLRASGVMSYVRGKNRDTGDNLYNQMPLNLKLTLDHRSGHWSNALEARLVDAKDRVQAVRKELQTAGYGLLNFYSSYTWKQARFDLGIENLLDKHYDDPLGGAYVGQGETMGTGVPHGEAVPGMGRSVNTRLTLNF